MVLAIPALIEEVIKTEVFLGERPVDRRADAGFCEPQGLSAEQSLLQPVSPLEKL